MGYFDGKQEVLVKHGDEVIIKTIKDLYDRIEEGSFKFMNDYRILNNGEWVRGDIVKSDKKTMYKITTTNNKQIFVTEDHLNPTQRGDIYTKDLTEEDYIQFNTKAVEGFSKATYEEGYIVGAFGSSRLSEFDINEKDSYIINISMDKKYSEKFMTFCAEIDKKIKNYNMDEVANNEVILTFISKPVHDLILKYIEIPTYKDINIDCILDSIEFRKGIIDGFNITPKYLLVMNANMSKSIEAIYTSLGIVSKINILENSGQILCTKSNCIDDIHIIKDDKRFYRIKSITPYELSDEYTYCFNMEDKENPYFTLPNGVVTHS